MSPVRAGESRRPKPDPFSIPLGFKLWMAFCGLLSLGLLAVAVWAIIRLVNHFTA